MNINGIGITGPKNEFIVFPGRLENGGDLVIEVAPVLNFEKFDDLVKRPEPPQILLPGNLRTTDPDDKKYLKALEEYGTQRTAYIVIKSLSATKDLVWDTVDINDPSSWANWRVEMEAAGFSQLEMGRIFTAITICCGLNQDKIDEATKLFYQSLSSQKED